MRERMGVLIMMAMLAACSEKSQLTEKIEERADNRAEAMEAAARSMTNALQQNAAEQQAATVRQAGEERAEAIRKSQLDPEKLTAEQKAKLVDGSLGTGPAATR